MTYNGCADLLSHVVKQLVSAMVLCDHWSELFLRDADVSSPSLQSDGLNLDGHQAALIGAMLQGCHLCGSDGGLCAGTGRTNPLRGVWVSSLASWVVGANTLYRFISNRVA